MNYIKIKSNRTQNWFLKPDALESTWTILPNFILIWNSFISDERKKKVWNEKKARKDKNFHVEQNLQEQRKFRVKLSTAESPLGKYLATVQRSVDPWNKATVWRTFLGFLRRRIARFRYWCVSVLHTKRIYFRIRLFVLNKRILMFAFYLLHVVFFATLIYSSVRKYLFWQFLIQSN